MYHQMALCFRSNLCARRKQEDYSILKKSICQCLKHHRTFSNAQQFSYGKDFVVQRKCLERHQPYLGQYCHYHSVVKTRTLTHAASTRLLLKPWICSPHSTSYRHLSLAWLDSLAITQAGWFQALSRSQLVEGLMDGLQAVHDHSHLSWWSSIILSTILMRSALTFPLAVYQKYILAKVENLKPEMDQLVQELKKETAYAMQKFGWNKTHARRMYNRSARRMWKELIIRENCHPFKASALLLVQIPLWISMSMSLRNLASMMPHQDAAAQILFLQLSTGGFAWIPNLTEVDHSLIFPVALGLVNLAITEVNALSRLQKGSRIQTVATNFFRFISIVMIPIATTVPSCVVLYWVTSSMCGLTQTLVLMHPGLLRMLRIPHAPSQIQNPYHHLWQQLLKKVERKGRAEG